MRKQRNVSRRRFIKTSAAAGAATMAFPYIVPNHVLGQQGRVGANDQIVIANIGVGGRGSDHVRTFHRMGGVRIGALCDVDAGNVAKNARVVGGNPFTHKDYRKILERKDIDAVVIATPDHWHAIMMIEACQTGKDVYTEKPTCRTIQEGFAMVNAAEHNKRVVQVGSQGRSEPTVRQLAEYVRNGQVGKVHEVEVWHPENLRGGMTENSDPPASLDWEQWLGPARWRPYNKSIHPFSFRWILDIGGGFIRDRGNHALSCVFYAMDADKTQPVSVEATGEHDKRGIYDAPYKMEVKWEFKNPDYIVTWSQPGRQRPLPGVMDRRTGAEKICDWGAEFKGDKGSVILYHGDGADVEKKAKDYKPPAGGVILPKSPGHQENWVQCIKTRELPIMPIRSGVAVITLPVIANISYLVGRKLQFDPATRTFIGDDEANRLLADPYRAPWHV
jgi:predicted dehydrogenase